jgi:hypothetical protein
MQVNVCVDRCTCMHVCVYPTGSVSLDSPTIQESQTNGLGQIKWIIPGVKKSGKNKTRVMVNAILRLI